MSDHVLRDVPVGIAATGTRREVHGSVSTSVRADKYWGAVTQRSLNTDFSSVDRLPERFHRCYGITKKAAAAANGQAGRLPLWKATALGRAADDLIAGRLSDHFPLTVWQSGSGRETDTNVNEVLANRAIQLLGGAIGSRAPIDPVNDLDPGQSLTAMFMTTLHIATVLELEETLMPSAAALARALDRAAMVSLAERLRVALARIDEAEGGLHEIVSDKAADGLDTAGPDWRAVAAFIAGETGRPFIPAPGDNAGPGSLDAVVAAMAAVRGLAVALLDITEPHGRGGPERGSAIRSPLEATSMVCVNVTGPRPGRHHRRLSWPSRRAGIASIIVMSVLNAIRTIGEACQALRRVIASGDRK